MIRKATRYDIPILLNMLKEYCKEIPIKSYKRNELQNVEYATNLLFTIIKARGFILIDNDYRGMLIAVVTANIWFPKSYELNELAWWVKPEFRQASIGGKLWLEFNKEAQKMLDEKRVDVIYTSLMENSPSIDYEKRKFKKLETKYFRE
jgi:hypothetical protein